MLNILLWSTYILIVNVVCCTKSSFSLIIILLGQRVCYLEPPGYGEHSSALATAQVSEQGLKEHPEAVSDAIQDTDTGEATEC